MLHAAAMLAGCFILWMALTQRWHSLVDIVLAGAVAVACALVAARLGAGGAGFARAPALAMLALARAGAVARGAWATIRAAIAADVTLRPALVRVKTRAQGVETRAALAAMITAPPGALVVDADGDGLLVHVNDEESVDPAAISRLEARVLAITGERP